MRRKYFGLAIAALATLGPMQAFGGDREIAEQIIKRLKTNRDSGALKDFTLDMKVDQGVVLFRGNVSQDSQKELVLSAAKGIEGIAKVVDEVVVAGATAEQAAAAEAQVLKPKAAVASVDEAPQAAEPASAVTNPVAPFIMPAMPLVTEDSAIEDVAVTEVAPEPAAQALAVQEVMPGQILRTAAEEPTTDEQVVAAVVAALSKAKDNGELKGFGVDVKSRNGVLQLTGRASSASQRDTIIRIAEAIPGVSGVREAIAIPTAAPSLPSLPQPPSLQEIDEQGMSSVANQAPQPLRQGTPAIAASAPLGVPTVAAPYRTQGGPQPTFAQPAANAYPVNNGYSAMPAAAPGYGAAPVAGQPVPIAPYSAAGAGAGPRYDTPNLPNYAWPGYAAYPNYAALTYPQQYSPSAFPYIGPFYPYPQVPLGWRKVSLEWDDGWWFLDFTDK